MFASFPCSQLHEILKLKYEILPVDNPLSACSLLVELLFRSGLKLHLIIITK